MAKYGFQGTLCVGVLQKAAYHYGLLPALIRNEVPDKQGVYAVVKPQGYIYSLRKVVCRGKWLDLMSTGAHGKRWIPDTDIIYIGKGGGPNVKETLQARIQKLIRHGLGKVNNHKGGQDIWLLERDDTFLVYWKECDNPRVVEKQLINQFKQQHGRKRPFGNKQD